MNIPTLIANTGRSVGDLLTDVANGGNVSTYQAPPLQDRTYNVRGATLNENDLKQLGGVMFGEISNNPQTQADEAKTVANTLINRMPQYHAQGGQYTNITPSAALARPKQYKAYGGPQYQKYMTGNLTAADQAKLNVVNSTLAQLRTGNFPDTTNGSVRYTNPGGQVTVQAGPLFAPPASAGRSVADLADTSL